MDTFQFFVIWIGSGLLLVLAAMGFIQICAEIKKWNKTVRPRKVWSAKVLEDGTFVIRGTFGRKKLRQDQGPKEWED